MSSIPRTGTGTFFQRWELTQRLEDMLKPFLVAHGVQVWDWGQSVITGNDGSLEAHLKRLVAKSSPAALTVKFAPDLVCHATEHDRLFFADIKTSLTPVLFDSKLAEIRSVSGRRTLYREQVGLVEREAWDNYTTRYPPMDMAIIMACPYHPRLLIAEWVNKITPLFRFQQDINENAAGSKTPHVNIDLDSMRPLDRFLSDECGVGLIAGYYDGMIEFVKTWPLSNPGRPWNQFNSAVERLQVTCPWLRRRNREGFLDPEYPGGGLPFSG